MNEAPGQIFVSGRPTQEGYLRSGGVEGERKMTGTAYWRDEEALGHGPQEVSCRANWSRPMRHGRSCHTLCAPNLAPNCAARVWRAHLWRRIACICSSPPDRPFITRALVGDELCATAGAALNRARTPDASGYVQLVPGLTARVEHRAQVSTPTSRRMGNALIRPSREQSRVRQGSLRAAIGVSWHEPGSTNTVQKMIGPYG